MFVSSLCTCCQHGCRCSFDLCLLHWPDTTIGVNENTHLLLEFPVMAHGMSWYNCRFYCEWEGRCHCCPRTSPIPRPNNNILHLIIYFPIYIPPFSLRDSKWLIFPTPSLAHPQTSALVPTPPLHPTSFTALFLS